MPEAPTPQRRSGNVPKEERDNNIRLIQKQKAQLRRDMAETFSSPAGRRSLRWLMEAGGYQKPNAIENQDGEMQIQSMLYNEARRGMYLALRQYIPLETLIAVENKGLGDDPAETDIFS